MLVMVATAETILTGHQLESQSPKSGMTRKTDCRDKALDEAGVGWRETVVLIHAPGHQSTRGRTLRSRADRSQGPLGENTSTPSRTVSTYSGRPACGSGRNTPAIVSMSSLFRIQ